MKNSKIWITWSATFSRVRQTITRAFSIWCSSFMDLTDIVDNSWCLNNYSRVVKLRHKKWLPRVRKRGWLLTFMARRSRNPRYLLKTPTSRIATSLLWRQGTIQCWLGGLWKKETGGSKFSRYTQCSTSNGSLFHRVSNSKDSVPSSQSPEKAMG